MIDAICRRAFFQFEITIGYRAPMPLIDGDVSKWDRRYLLPPLVELEGTEPFADVYAAWNEDGLVVAFDVPRRPWPLRSDPSQWWKLDGVRICVDTRDARENRRATRFCHFFYVLPTGGGPRGDRPVVGLHRMSRSREVTPVSDVTAVKAATRQRRSGWGLEVAIPASCLHGWDPVEQPRIGFFYKIKDIYHGSQHLTVDDELGWNADPSTWATAVLVR